jgi:hypothetical protein
MFSPELAPQWVLDQESQSDAPVTARDDESLSPAQQEALEALVDRVNAARSIV